MKVIEELSKPKRKKFSKNKKKAWRTKIDISYIEDALEDQRREERYGGALGDRVSTDLFSLDYGTDDPTEAIRKKALAKKPIESETHLVKKLSKKIRKDEGLKPKNPRKEVKALKCHEYINGLRGVKAISKKGGVMKQREKRCIKTARKLRKNTHASICLKNGIAEQRKKALKEKKTVKKLHNFKKDLWNTDTNKIGSEEKRFDETDKTYINEAMDFRNEMMRLRKVKTPAIRSVKPSLLPSVVLPAPGASYNPSFEDHRALVTAARKEEQRKKRAAEKENRLAQKFLPSGKGISQGELLVELCEGLPSSLGLPSAPVKGERDDPPLAKVKQEKGEEGGKVKEELPDDTTAQSQVVPHVKEEVEDEMSTITFAGQGKRERRSRQARQRVTEVKIREQKRLKRKKLKQMENQVYNLKNVQEEVEKAVKKPQKTKQKKKQKKEEDLYKTHKLSMYKFEEEALTVSKPHELAGNLRKMETRGSGLDGLFKNFQRRNIIETTVPHKKSKAKTKLYLRKGYKDTMTDFVNSLTVNP